MRRHRIWFLNFELAFALVGVAAYLYALPVWAVDAYSPRITALAGAGRAGPLLNDSIVLNPSYISFLPAYSIGGYFTRVTNGDHGRNYQVSVQDGRNDNFQAGVAYTKREDVSMVHVAASKAPNKQVSIGLSGKYWYTNRITPKDTGFDTGVSVTTLVNTWFQTAFVADNLLLPESARNTLNVRREFALATKANLANILMVYFDPQYTSGIGGNPGISAGLELAALQDFFIRGGFQNRTMLPWLHQYGRAWGMGAGWIAPKISLDYGYGRSMAPIKATTHVFGATIYF